MWSLELQNPACPKLPHLTAALVTKRAKEVEKAEEKTAPGLGSVNLALSDKAVQRPASTCFQQRSPVLAEAHEAASIGDHRPFGHCVVMVH